MRVSMNMIYGQSVRNMNTQLARLLRLNQQDATQQRVNAPSDDPSGYARALDLSSAVAAIEQYQENIDTASGWLELADSSLQEVSDLATSIKELMEQAATGTLTADQRETIAKEARQLLHQMMTTANAEYAGDSIFAGTRTDGAAFTLGLGATVTEGGAGTAEVLSVSGSADSTVWVEFTSDGTVGTDALDYRYSTDGGSTWTNGTLAAGDTSLLLDGAQVNLASGCTVTANTEQGVGDGTSLRIRPAAYYQGDDNDGAEVVHYGASAVTAEATGSFGSKVSIRIDSGGTLPGPIGYSYSTDNGATWVTGSSTTDGVLNVPGGYVQLSPAGTAVSAGEQFIVAPHDADVDVSISSSSSVTISGVGKDIFGGLYVPDGSTTAQLADPDNPDTNLFEVVGEFIGYLETDNQDGIGDSLEKLTTAQEHLTTLMGVVGARMVRTEFASAALDRSKETLNSNVSNIMDADVSALSTEIAKTQYIYESVLSTSSQIMQLSLLNYL
jgi:flagellar hook-associated protein 3 FlgL